MKSELDSVKEWYKYNSYARKKYLNAIFTKIPAEERYKDRGASHPSILDIYIHVLDAYRYWFIYFYEDKLSEYEPLLIGKCYTRSETEAEEKKVDSHVMSLVEKLTPDDLEREVQVREDGEMLQFQLRSVLIHMIEEELQHRGELNAIFWQLDIDPPLMGLRDPNFFLPSKTRHEPHH